MGLRELRAERTRRAVLDAALDAFERQGYDGTTMEQIAERAEIGIATLYRYFPSKDSILLDPIVREIGSLARHFAGRSAEEPLSESLGHALEEFLAEADHDGERAHRLRAVLDRAVGPRAKLWDLWHQERALLEEAIGRRADVDPDELWVAVAAHTTMMIAEMALDLSRDRTDPRPASDWAQQLIELLDAEGVVLPRLPRRDGAPG